MSERMSTSAGCISALFGPRQIEWQSIDVGFQIKIRILSGYTMCIDQLLSMHLILGLYVFKILRYELWL